MPRKLSNAEMDAKIDLQEIIMNCRTISDLWASRTPDERADMLHTIGSAIRGMLDRNEPKNCTSIEKSAIDQRVTLADLQASHAAMAERCKTLELVWATMIPAEQADAIRSLLDAQEHIATGIRLLTI